MPLFEPLAFLLPLTYRYLVTITFAPRYGCVMKLIVSPECSSTVQPDGYFILKPKSVQTNKIPELISHHIFGDTANKFE
jgi:hypothetical protein